ncbi:arylsulfatase B-like [Lytechinus variegatus]|uniref:arylsulfatase B-like n=1 Tax=Lytechinus variegatus TaxID=7654 RepID=UPI001BB18A2A|nr:arylsulfatase B-like [Lytechinus variegatus]
MRIQFRRCIRSVSVVLFFHLVFLDQYVAFANGARARASSRSRTNGRRTQERPASRTSSTITLSAGSVYPDIYANGKKTKNEPKSEKKKQPPNVILIIADDLGYNDVGYHAKYGQSLIRTPNIDQMAYSGVRLENYYVQPVCTPTRSQLVTGRYQIHTGMQHLNLFPGRPRCLPLDETTIAQAMQKLGYSTHAVGKWHLGYAWKDCLPSRRGFQSFFGNVMGSADHWSHNKTSIFENQKVNGKSMYYNERIYWKHEGTFSTTLYTNRARQIIRKQPRNKPLFLYLAYEAVHTPLNVPDQYSRPYEGIIGNSKRQKYAGLVNILDEAVKNISEALKYNGLYDNSVIIFTTDNGGRARPRSVGNNWPLRGGKSTLWEGGIRGVGFVHSPLIHWDLRGTVNRQLIHVSDWFPTIVKGIAGGKLVTNKPLDGVNQWKTISKGAESNRREILHNIDPIYPAALWTRENERDFGPLNNLPFNATMRASIRVGNWKLSTGLPHEDFWEPPRESSLPYEPNDIRWSTPVRLYNIKKDPNERQNVAPYQKKVVYRLLKRLQDYQNTAVTPLLLGEKDDRGNPKYHGGAWVPWMDR